MGSALFNLVYQSDSGLRVGSEFSCTITFVSCEELDGSAVRTLGVSRKLSNFRKGQSSDGWSKLIMSSSSVLWKAR
jgi:hypothetical protein